LKLSWPKIYYVHMYQRFGGEYWIQLEWDTVWFGTYLPTARYNIREYRIVRWLLRCFRFLLRQ
jgi:hypothetical protein